ncbi:MAG: prepilin-type N-terminal cleavage/methylation domain-containing protein [Chthoniobacteraceae bacterium]|nr:prepilin-type N-terminal cleavage/methylation domain-containing protein [Chthoniobacteraceae bacterium]
MNPRRPAFTLIEMLVAMGVLLLVVGMIAHLCNSAQIVTGMGHRQMDADAQARAVFDRMAIDFAQMVRRPDADCFLKDLARPQPGNDQIAFFSQVPGYYPSTGSESPVSLVAYRVNAARLNQLERFGAGLVWGGDSTGNPPMVFLPVRIADKWESATNQDADSHYELAGPQVFRLEYYYVLKGQEAGGGAFASVLTETPWDTRIQGIAGVPDHTAADGLRDVAAIGVVIAVMDPKTRALVKPEALVPLVKALEDFDPGTHAQPGALEARWQEAVNASGLPGTAISGIHIYRRWFYLDPGFSL